MSERASVSLCVRLRLCDLQKSVCVCVVCNAYNYMCVCVIMCNYVSVVVCISVCACV